MPLSRGLALILSLIPSLVHAETRPNFLFVYTDDQRWDAMSVVQKEQGDKARFPWLKTPHMDRLAADGVRFRNAFVVNSLCAPSRASFLTGCYGHVNGIVNNHTPFSDKNVTHATLLRAAGYKTGYVGKWHMGGQSGQRPGHDFSASFVGQGKYVDCPIEVNGVVRPSKGWVDDVSTDYAIQFIKDNKDRPFSLSVGFKATHGPFDPPQRRKEDYAGEQARAVPNLNTPAIYKTAGKKPAVEGDKVPVNLNYLRCITAADDNLGRLLDLLDEMKLADNTVVIFASDNGYYTGEHGLGDKRSAYEESMRIPLIVRAPKLANKKGTTLDSISLNIDLAPTLLDYAGVAIPKEIQGKSWKPLLEGTSTEWRKAFFYCYYLEGNFAVPTVTAVRTETAKLVRYPGHDDWTEAFDLTHDPYEMKNLVKDVASAGMVRDLQAQYEKQKEAIRFVIPEFADEKRTPAKGPTATVPNPLNKVVLDYRFEKDTADEVKDISGKDHHGKAHGVPLEPAAGNNNSRKFDGKGYIDVPKNNDINPAVAGFTIDLTFKADKPDGIILAHGGATQGYCIHLEAGRPAFTVVSDGKRTQVMAAKAVDGWTAITAKITADKKLVLMVDGVRAGKTDLPNWIAKDPANGLQIGTDLGSQVLEAKKSPQFTGLIGGVKLYSGDAP
ncbi:hypothetical protein BH11PLA2_BH11PLA2_17880 [soil metagenome]